MSRSKPTLLSLILLLLLAVASALFLRWLIARHLVELLRPAAAVSGLAIVMLAMGLVALRSRRPAVVRLAGLAALVFPAIAVASFVAAPIWFGFARTSTIWWRGFSTAWISQNGHLLAYPGGWLPYYTEKWTQRPYMLLDVQSGRRFNVGMGANGSHTPFLTSLTFDETGCRAFWLRLEPNLRSISRVIAGWSGYPSRIAEESWPARLLWLDVCAGSGRPAATALTLPSLQTQLAVVGSGQYVAAYTESRLWVFDLAAQKLAAEFELPRDELRNWITSQTLAVDGTILTMVRKQYLSSLLETLELDLETHSLRRVSLIDFEAQPKPGFDSAEANLLAVEPTMETAIVRRVHTRRLQPKGLEFDGDLELYSLTEGSRLLVLDEAGFGVLSGSAIYLAEGHVALADDLYTRSTGILHIVSRSGEVLMTREWPGTNNFHVVSETPRGAILVGYRNPETEDRHLELFDPKTLETKTVATGYFPVGRTDTGILVGNEEEILEIDEDLNRRVVLSGM